MGSKKTTSTTTSSRKKEISAENFSAVLRKQLIPSLEKCRILFRPHPFRLRSKPIIAAAALSYSFEFEGTVSGPGANWTMIRPASADTDSVIRLTGASLSCNLDTKLTASRLRVGTRSD